jgi:hypothetical protein
VFVPQAKDARDSFNILIRNLAGIVGKFQAVWIAGYAVIGELVQDFSHFVICGLAEYLDAQHWRIVPQPGINLGQRAVGGADSARSAVP